MPGNDDLIDLMRDMPDDSRLQDEFRREIWRKHGTECAVMVLDSSGFTRSSRDLGIIRYLSCISKLRDLIRSVLKTVECISFRFAADNAYAQFPSADDAFSAACAIQESVASSGIEICPGCEFKVCIGIGFGRMLVSRDEGVFGDQMNHASKLGEDIAGPGDILMTEDAYNALEPSLAENFDPMEASVSGVVIKYYARRK